MTQHVVVPVSDFDTGLRQLLSLGLRVDRISPADAPSEADLSKGPLLVRLQRTDSAAIDAGALTVDDLERSAAGGGPCDTREVQPPSDEVTVPPNVARLVVSRIADSEGFGAGRAGMGYRDLLPDRWGGRFIASHIRIDGGGPVPDYAHYHRIRFQMIYCHRGWVRVVYEDQGDEFVLNAGDCVLQPPEIRHRVLESSPGLEVVEIGCPAEHDTFADHAIELPTGVMEPGRDFGGQRFVRHVADETPWQGWRHRGFECRDTGIAVATDGLAGARTVRAQHPASTPLHAHDGEFQLLFVRDGSLVLKGKDVSETLGPGDSVAIPGGWEHELSASANTNALEVTLPGALVVD